LTEGDSTNARSLFGKLENFRKDKKIDELLRAGSKAGQGGGGGDDE